MSKLLLALGTVTATLALSHASPADARGGHSGGFSFGGASFSSHRSVAPKFVQPSRPVSIKPVQRVRDTESHRVATSSIKVQDHARRVHVDKPVHEKIVSKPVKPVTAGIGPSTPKAGLAGNHHLSSTQLLKAKLEDHNGRKYNVTTKGWWDGKHWWYGRFAWLYVDDTWYYGNSVWRETNGSWSGDGIAEMPVCVDCRQVASAPVSPRIETTAVASPPKEYVAPRVTQKPKVEPKVVSPVEPAAVAPITTATALPSVAAIGAAQPTEDPASGSTTNERECRKYLPQLGMAVTVPCAD